MLTLHVFSRGSLGMRGLTRCLEWSGDSSHGLAHLTGMEHLDNVVAGFLHFSDLIYLPQPSARSTAWVVRVSSWWTSSRSRWALYSQGW